MDVRLDVNQVLHLEPGDAHIVRNAGGVVTDDVVRSISLSQRLLGSNEVTVVRHTDCAMEGLDEAPVREALTADLGEPPAWTIGSFTDVREDLARSLEELRSLRALPHRDRIRGYIYDVSTGGLEEVSPAG